VYRWPVGKYPWLVRITTILALQPAFNDLLLQADQVVLAPTQFLV